MIREREHLVRGQQCVSRRHRCEAHRAALLRWLDELDAEHSSASPAEIAAATALVEQFELSSPQPGARVPTAVVLDAVITSDAGDIAELTSAVPGTRIVVRAPDLRQR
jgi:hypothetical protein